MIVFVLLLLCILLAALHLGAAQTCRAGSIPSSYRRTDGAVTRLLDAQRSLGALSRTTANLLTGGREPCNAPVNHRLAAPQHFLLFSRFSLVVDDLERRRLSAAGSVRLGCAFANYASGSTHLWSVHHHCARRLCLW